MGFLSSVSSVITAVGFIYVIVVAFDGIYDLIYAKVHKK